MTTQAAPRSFTVSYSTLAFLFLVANLRPAVTSVGPLLEMVRSDLGLSGATLGLLATLPLLIFAGFSPFARLGQIFGVERTLAGCLVLVIVGIALRSSVRVVERARKNMCSANSLFPQVLLELADRVVAQGPGPREVRF